MTDSLHIAQPPTLRVQYAFALARMQGYPEWLLPSDLPEPYKALRRRARKVDGSCTADGDDEDEESQLGPRLSRRQRRTQTLVHVEKATRWALKQPCEAMTMSKLLTLTARKACMSPVGVRRYVLAVLRKIDEEEEAARLSNRAAAP